MCGRFSLSSDAEVLQQIFELMGPPPVQPRYNIAPGQPIAAVRVDEAASEGQRHFVHLVWGLIPPWARDPSIGNRMINARSETLSDKASYRNAFRRRRCLVPADGFYEWQKQAGGKQPHFVRMADGSPFAMAGLWERWQSPDGSELDSCTIVTTAANELMAPIHDRMPVILDTAGCALWLEHRNDATEHVADLLRPFPADKMTAYPVSRLVNSPQNDSPQCIEPIEPPGKLF